MRIRATLTGLTALTALAGCNDAATTAVVQNAGEATVFKVWWSTTLFAVPVAAGAASGVERTVEADDFAYALLAPGWDPEAGGRPPRLVAVRSKEKLAVSSHDLLRIVVSPDTFTGDCATGAPLDVQDAALIVERIFPADFAGRRYDPATCTATDEPGDAAAPDAAVD